ncbi:MAG: hypothetical protein QMD50_02065 [Patescibacteria group bacterium]|nr:hypothetical protein [Patescibacteria group bacterium]
MRRFLVFLGIIIIGGAVAYNFAPENARNKTKAFLKETLSGNIEEAKNLVKNEVVPESPKEKRETLITELKNNISEIKNHVNNFQKINREILKDKNNISSSTAKLLKEFQNENFTNRSSTEAYIAKTETILKQLEQTSGESSVKESFTERILDKILPPKAGECAK